MHPARLWKALSGGKVQCRLCSHFCLIEEGLRGKCGVRVNEGGALFTLTYDRVAAVNIDPVEKKPLYHFLPGTRTFSIATMGCNLSCSFCQNYDLSQPPRRGRDPSGQPATPEGLVAAALERGCASISYTYSEPTIFFELMQDTARLASSKGLKNIMVSNGFQSPDCLEELGPLIHAANIDLKGFKKEFYEKICGAKLTPVKKNLVRMRELGWWLEVTTLLIPGLNDEPAELREMADFLAAELGPDVPWHLSRFHPDHDMRDRGVTPLSSLEKAWKIGKEAGLRYVYVGNVPGDEHNSTFCPGCGEKVIDRSGFAVLGNGVKSGKCAACGHKIAGIFE